MTGLGFRVSCLEFTPSYAGQASHPPVGGFRPVLRASRTNLDQIVTKKRRGSQGASCFAERQGIIDEPWVEMGVDIAGNKDLAGDV